MLHQLDLTDAERASVAAAIARDPTLGEELEAIAAMLAPGARGRFLRAFAADCDGRRRPAAAVPAALERAILG